MSWAEREPDEPLEGWMLRLQISHAAMGSWSQAAASLDTQDPIRFPAPGTSFIWSPAGLGWVTFRHCLPDPVPVPGGPS
jgi:hypothetical protein